MSDAATGDAFDGGGGGAATGEADPTAAGRFDAAAMTAVVLVTVGVILGNAVLFVAAAVPVVYLAAAALATPPPASAVSVERTVDPVAPPAGEPATVTVTLHNGTDRTLPDVRVVDRPPADAAVESSPRGCLALRPGERDSITYAVRAGHGELEFADPVVRLRPLTAVGTATGRPTAAGDDVLRCRRPGATAAVEAPSRRRVGTRPADTPGSGLEFHSVREYRHGDDVGRVDWRRLAKTGDLATVNFREPHATETVVVVDGRRTGGADEADGAPGAELSAYAADRVVAGLLAEGNRVGLAALGVGTDDVAATVPGDRHGRPWVPVGEDPQTRRRIEAVLAAVEATSEGDDRAGAPVGDGVQRRVEPVRPAALRERLPAGTDVVLVTPALDDASLELAGELAAAGHPLVVVSPDATAAARTATAAGGSTDRGAPGRTTTDGGTPGTTGTPGTAVAGIERHIRLDRLRAGGTPVVDWDTAVPLAVAMEGSP